MPKQKILDAQMRHARMKEKLPLRRNEGEQSAPCDKHSIHAVCCAQFLE